MNSQPVELLGFDDDDALDEMFTGFRILADYKSFLPAHLTQVFREQHPHAELRTLELLGTPKCNLGGMPSPGNPEHVVPETIKIPLELRVHLSTNGNDLHELDITLEINAVDVQSTPTITTDMFVQKHNVVS